MAAHSGSSIANDGLVFSYDMSNTKKSWKGKPTTNIIADAGKDCSAEYSGTSYPFVSANITSQVKAAWSSSNNTFAMQFEGYRDYVAGGTGGGNDGYPVMYIYFTDWSWASTLGIGDYDWTYREKTFTMPDPTNKSIYFAIYHMNSTNRGKSYARNFQIEQSSFPTPFVNGTRSSTESIIDLVGGNTTTNNLSTYNSDGSFEFDGVGDYLNISDFGYPNYWNDSFSLEAWIYIPTGADWHNQDNGTTSNSGTAIIGRGSYTGSHGLARVDTRQFRFIIRTNDGSYSRTYTNASYDTWYHLVGTYDGDTSSLYVNGVLHQAGVISGKSGVPDGGAWRVGGAMAFGGNNGRYGEGEIPEAKIYNKALTAQEVKQNFEANRIKYGI
jgi:hypothetical protein